MTAGPVAGGAADRRDEDPEQEQLSAPSCRASGNLDNAFIYNTVVRSLLGTKGKRQLIFISHNANVPVLGAAERVFVMGSDGKRGRVSLQGTVDEVKDHIETLLEGGRGAFLLRKERYGL